MTALVIAIALVVGIIFSEWLARGVHADAWPTRRFAAMRDELRQFYAAIDDDARQRHLIRGGVITLTLSLAVLGAIAVLAAIFAAPLVLMGWDSAQSAVYFGVSAASAIAWWMLRRARNTR